MFGQRVPSPEAVRDKKAKPRKAPKKVRDKKRAKEEPVDELGVALEEIMGPAPVEDLPMGEDERASSSGQAPEAGGFTDITPPPDPTTGTDMERPDAVGPAPDVSGPAVAPPEPAPAEPVPAVAPPAPEPTSAEPASDPAAPPAPVKPEQGMVPPHLGHVQ